MCRSVVSRLEGQVLKKVISPSPTLPLLKAFPNSSHSVISHESMGTYSARAIICCHVDSCLPSPPESNNVSSDGIFCVIPSYVYGHTLSCSSFWLWNSYFLKVCEYVLMHIFFETIYEIVVEPSYKLLKHMLAFLFTPGKLGGVCHALIRKLILD